MGNHGIMVVGKTVAETFNNLYYFERACEIYIKTLWTGREMAVLSDEIAAEVAEVADSMGIEADRHLDSIKQLLDRLEPDYRE